MVRRTYGESSDEDEPNGEALVNQTPPSQSDSEEDIQPIYTTTHHSQEMTVDDLLQEVHSLTTGASLNDMDDLFLVEGEKTLDTGASFEEDTPVLDTPVFEEDTQNDSTIAPSIAEEEDDIECY
jgi:hypothetical protein